MITETRPEHIYDNACDAICNICSAERTVTDHVYICSVCGVENDSNEKVGLSVGAVIGIVVGTIILVGSGEFAICRFIFKKNIV
jgi:hypothetical protein